MITEDYVSFETAKLLKEKGFDAICSAFYIKYTDGSVKLVPTEAVSMVLFAQKYAFSVDTISVPSLQMAMKWLREVHGLHVDIDPLEGNWCIKIVELEDLCEVDKGIALYGTYEEAAEAGIRYCLENLI